MSSDGADVANRMPADKVDAMQFINFLLRRALRANSRSEEKRPRQKTLRSISKTIRGLLLGDGQHLSHAVVFRKDLQIPFHFRLHLIILFVLDELVDQGLANAGIKGLQGHGLAGGLNRLVML